MGELPAFITDVPEESLSKSEITRKPTRIQVKKRLTKTTVGLSEIFTVPKGYFLELLYWSFSCINTDPSTFNVFDFEAATGGDRFIFKEVILDHKEHYAESIALQTPFILESGDVLFLNIGGAPAGTHLRVTFYGNLISIQDRDLI